MLVKYDQAKLYTMLHFVDKLSQEFSNEFQAFGVRGAAGHYDSPLGDLRCHRCRLKSSGKDNALFVTILVSISKSAVDHDQGSFL